MQTLTASLSSSAGERLFPPAPRMLPTSQESVPTPGTLVFCHSHGIVGSAIRWGERLHGRAGSFYNHVGIISDRLCPIHQSPYVIQAVGAGVTDFGCLSAIAPGGSYELITPPPDIDGNNILAFAELQIGDEYGWLSIVSIILRLIAPHWLPLPSLRSRRTWVCSALGAESLRGATWFYDWPDIYQVTPAQLYAALKGISEKALQDSLH